MNNAVQVLNGINPQMKVSVQKIGREQNAVIIIDDFFAQPNVLITKAEGYPEFTANASDFYPGLRKMITGDYGYECQQAVAPLIREIFGVDETLTPRSEACVFSLATTPQHKLRPIQCVPHIDTHQPNQFALVHYLCSERFSGTSFYRHRATGYETINSEQLEDYFKLLKSQVMNGGLPEFNYIDGDTELFERIGNIELKFNRAIIYKSNALHSGNLNAESLSDEPRQGRLTANLLMRFA
jgi:hypothetical protein